MSEIEKPSSAEELFGSEAVEQTELGGGHNPFEGMKFSEEEQKELDKQTGAYQARLEKSYWQDELTGMHKYHAEPCLDLLQRTLNSAERQKQPVTFVILDIDYFKVVNDRYGHPFGDLVIKAFARALDEGSRDSDTVFRMGGEEFGLFLPGMTADYYDHIHHRILEKWKEELEGLRGDLKKLGVSPTDGKEITDDEIDSFVNGLTFSGAAVQIRPLDFDYDEKRDFKYPKLKELREEVDHLSGKAKLKRNITILKDKDGKTKEFTNMGKATNWVDRDELDSDRYGK